MMTFVNNTELDNAMETLIVGDPNDKVVINLVSYLRKKWEDAKFAKVHIEQQMIRMLRQRNGVYDPEKLAAIRKVGSSEVFMMVTDTKCRVAEAWLKDILLSTGTIPWDLRPTPIPDLPDEIEIRISQEVMIGLSSLAQQQIMQTGVVPDAQQMVEVGNQLVEAGKGQIQKEIKELANKKVELMKEKIKDQLFEGNWYETITECIHDVVTLKGGIIKGPFPKMETIKERVKNKDGSWNVVYKEQIIPSFERRSPFDIYPAPDAVNIQDSYLFDRMTIEPIQLANMVGLPGWDDDEIKAVLEEHRFGKLREWTLIDSERIVLEQRDSNSIWNTNKIDCLNYWGTIPGYLLLEWGINKKEIEEPWRDYHAAVWLIGTHVVKAVINKDKRGHRPYTMAGFEDVPGSFWKKGLPEIIHDLQTICNAIARAAVNNVGIASGPQVEMNKDRLPDDDGTIYPWKVWQSSSDQMASAAPALKFYVPPMIADKLMVVYQYFNNLADEQSGIPAYAHGSGQVGGAGNTASGLSMLMTQASRQIKIIIQNLDVMIEQTIERLYDYNIMYEGADLIGDLKVIAKGASSLIAKEQQIIRRTEFMATANNPVDLQIMGLNGRKYLLTEIAKSLEMDVDKIFPEEMGAVEQLPIGGPVPPKKSATTDLAGNKVVGQDTRLFQNDSGR